MGEIDDQLAETERVLGDVKAGEAIERAKRFNSNRCWARRVISPSEQKAQRLVRGRYVASF